MQAGFVSQVKYPGLASGRYPVRNVVGWGEDCNMIADTLLCLVSTMRVGFCVEH